MNKVIKVGDFRRLVAESSSEFKARLGTNVESDNKKNNGKAYSDAKKRAKDYDGGISDEVTKLKYEKTDANKTTMDYTPENATPEYKKRVKAQMMGYTSEAEKNNGIEKEGNFDGNERIYNGLKKNSKEMKDNVEDFKKSGLQARELPDETFKKESMYENNNKRIKTCVFKKTEFLNENHMKSRIPDDFKVEGKIFKMKDKVGCEYLIEWQDNKAFILEHKNEAGKEKALDRMKELMGYKSSDTCTTRAGRLNENENRFQDTLNKMRGLKQ